MKNIDTSSQEMSVNRSENNQNIENVLIFKEASDCNVSSEDSCLGFEFLSNMSGYFCFNCRCYIWSAFYFSKRCS